MSRLESLLREETEFSVFSLNPLTLFANHLPRKEKRVAMTIGIVVAISVIVSAVLWLIAIYNNLVSLRVRSNGAWSDIDVQLKRRHDLIPNVPRPIRNCERANSSVIFSRPLRALKTPFKTHAATTTQWCAISTPLWSRFRPISLPGRSDSAGVNFLRSPILLNVLFRAFK